MPSPSVHSPAANRVLDEMKTRVEQLWQLVIHASSDDKKLKLREEYQKAYKAYSRQQHILSDGDEVPEQQPESHQDSPSIYSFFDYREFLLAWFRYQSEVKKIPVKVFMEKVGISVEVLTQIMKRARPMSYSTLRKLIPHLGLSAAESSFLEALHKVSETDVHQERIQAVKHLLSFPAYRKVHPNECEAWRYLSHWYYVAIREMSTLGGFQLDEEWIQERLRCAIPLSEIRKALKFLQGAGFYRVEKDGSVVSLLKQVNCFGGVFRLGLSQFHREMLTMAIDAIEKTPSDQRAIMGHTTAISKENYELIKTILNDALKKIESLPPGEQSSDDVYHVGLFAIPLTKGFDATT